MDYKITRINKLNKIKKEYVFKSDDLKLMYLRILKKYLKEYDLKMIAYCIMGNHAHMLLNMDDVNKLSKCMHSINTTFAKNYNEQLKRVGYVFRNRFESEPIYENQHLFNCIRYIHMNLVKAFICNKQNEYYFSSYNDFVISEKTIDNDILSEPGMNESTYNELLKESTERYNFIDESLNLEECKNWLNIYLANKHLTMEYVKMNEGILKNVIMDLKECCKTRNVDIEEILEINKWKLRRILDKKG